MYNGQCGVAQGSYIFGCKIGDSPSVGYFMYTYNCREFIHIYVCSAFCFNYNDLWRLQV